MTRFVHIFDMTDSDWIWLSDDDVSKRRTDITQESKDLCALSATIREMIDFSSEDQSMEIVKQKKNIYDQLLCIKASYQSKLAEVVKERQASLISANQ